MNLSQAKARIEKLRTEINRLNYEYFVLDQSNVSEAVRDSLKKELIELENLYPELITSDSPTQRVGSVLSGKFPKVIHLTPKKSLKDVFSYQELEEWEERLQKLVPGEKRQYVCELKIDGLNITVHFKKGHYTQAITRGNGIEGEDVTHSVKTIKSLPLILNEPIDLEVSGEVYLPLASFAKVNAEQQKNNEPVFANPRNAAAGTIRQLDPLVAEKRDLDLFFYSLEKNDLKENPFTQMDKLAALKRLGLKVNSQAKLCSSLEEVKQFCDYWGKNRETLPFQIDGVVVKVNSVKEQEKMGFTAKYPRFMVAYKFAAAQATTVIEDIIVQVGRTGALTPVALLTPTLVSGSTVSRATLHNQDEIDRKDIRVGDTVIIQKAGDVIPEVVEVLKDLRPEKTRKFQMPDVCPVCGTKITKEETIYRCPNPNCQAIARESLIHFASKKAFNIDGLGEKVVSQLIKAGLVRNFVDFFQVSYEELLALPFFKTKKANNLFQAINKAKIVTLPRLIFALGIRHVGEEVSLVLSHYLKATDLADFINKVSKISLEELNQIEGIGPKIAESIYSWFQEEKNQQLLKDLENLGINLIAEHKNANQKFTGLTFVLTGTLTSLTRDQAQAEIQKYGGHIGGSVSSKTDYLVCGENAGSKLAKAKQLGVKILDEKQFLNLSF